MRRTETIVVKPSNFTTAWTSIITSVRNKPDKWEIIGVNKGEGTITIRNTIDTEESIQIDIIEPRQATGEEKTLKDIVKFLDR